MQHNKIFQIFCFSLFHFLIFYIPKPNKNNVDKVFLRAKELEVIAESLNATDKTSITAAATVAITASAAATTTAPPSAVEMMSAARYAAIINTEVIKGQKKH